MHRWLKKLTAFLMILVIVGSLLLIIFRTKFHGTIRSLAETQIKNTTSDLINDAIDKQIDVGNIQYDRIVYFEKDLNGKITALKTNMSEVNRLKTSILNIINDEILAMDTTDLGIPLGSLILPEMLAGRGPHIPVQILSISNSDASLESHFTAAGINQTRHKIYLLLEASVALVLPNESRQVEVGAQVPIAESIIVGGVPDSFVDVNNKEDLLNLLP